MLKSIAKLKWFFWERRAEVFWILLINLLINISIIYETIFLGNTVDEIAAGQITGGSLVRGVLILLLLAAGNFAMNAWWSYTINTNGSRIEYILQTKLMKTILSMSKPFFERFGAGELLTRANQSIRSISNLVGYGFMAFQDSILYLSMLILAMGFFISWKLTIISMLPVVLVAWATSAMSKGIHRYYTAEQEANGQMSELALEQIVGIRLMRAYGLGKQGEEKFAKLVETVYHKALASEMIMNSFDPMAAIVLSFSYILSFVFGAHMVSTGQLTLGQIVSFNIFISYMTWPMYAIGGLFNVAQRGASGIDKVYDVLEYDRSDSEEKENFSAENSDMPVGDFSEILFSDYSFTYPTSEHENLSEINLMLSAGQTLGIAGKTGSGKTTLIRQLLMEYPVGRGIFTINGQTVDGQNKTDMMRAIAYVSQDNILFSKSVAENIAIGLEKREDEKIIEAIRLADLTRDIEGFTDGMDTLVGERGIAISGGQKQRVSIARALVKNASLLLLDDALSAVDARTEKRILGNIKKQREGRSNIIVSHRLSTLSHADLIIVLDGGRIVERGTHEELMALDGWYAKQYNLQRLEEDADE